MPALLTESAIGAVLELPGRSTRAIVDLDAIVANVESARRDLPAGTAVMAVVKANAYGHGAIAVAKAVVEAGAELLGVATVDEGVQLRDAGNAAPIVVLGPADDSEIRTAMANRIELACGDLEFAEVVASLAASSAADAPVHVHLKVDTGMRRFGVLPREAARVAAFIGEQPNLRLSSVFTHFSRAEESEDAATKAQVDALQHVCAELERIGVRPDTLHAANTAAIMRSRACDLGVVRLGIGLYGIPPGLELPVAERFRPAMTVVSRLRRLFELAPGDEVSYRGTYRASRRERAALVPIGYADGFPRSLSNTAYMEIAGMPCPVLGTVCMDQTVIGIPDGLEVASGEPVIVVGAAASDQRLAIDALARQAGTIGYELAARIARRVPRFYVRRGQPVAVEDLLGYREFKPPDQRNE
jgi:alanine racemase